MTPQEYKHLKAFKDLIDDSVAQLKNAGSQATLASTAEALEDRWKPVHDEFAEVLGGIRAQAWSMPFPQARKVAEALITHLELTGESIQKQLNG